MDAGAFVPTLERARSAGVPIRARVWWRLGVEIDLLSRTPDEAHRIAAILVDARILWLRYRAFGTRPRDVALYHELSGALHAVVVDG